MCRQVWAGTDLRTKYLTQKLSLWRGGGMDSMPQLIQMLQRQAGFNPSQLRAAEGVGTEKL